MYFLVKLDNRKKNQKCLIHEHTRYSITFFPFLKLLLGQLAIGCPIHFHGTAPHVV